MAKPTAKTPRPTKTTGSTGGAKAPKSPKIDKTPEVDLIEQIAGNEAAYLRLLPIALALPAAGVRSYSADASLAYHNVDAGVKAVTAERAFLDERIVRIPWSDIADLPNLALAVCFSASQVEITTAPASGIATMLAEARPLRMLLLKNGDALAASGLLDVKTLEKIHEGRGDIDAARDLVDLAALFRKSWEKIARNHSVTKQQVQRAAELGSALGAVLKPKLARKGPKAEVLAKAIDARNRLWTLLVQGYAEARRLGGYRWIDEMDKHVPPLQARRSGRNKKKVVAPAEGAPGK